MKKVLIDTNIYSLAMKGDDEVVSVLRKIEAIGFSAISIGELISGFKGGSRETKNREELNLFLDSPRVVAHSIDESTAEFYAAVLHDLRAAGTPIPTSTICRDNQVSLFFRAFPCAGFASDVLALRQFEILIS